MANAPPTTALTLALTGFGVPSMAAHATTQELTFKGRLARGGKAFGLALLAALVMLPIPFIHILGPPLALLIGLVLGAKRLGDGTIFVSAEGECPFCHTAQRLGLAGSRFRLPCDLICRSCRQPLQLQAEQDAGTTKNA